MKLNADLPSPFTGAQTVFKEYIDESADYMLLDMDTGYVTMENLFNKKVWQDNMPESEIQPYIDSLIADIEPALREHVRWFDDQLWVLIQMGFNDIQLAPIANPNSGLCWTVSRNAEYYDDENRPTTEIYTFEKFSDAYDKFNFVCAEEMEEE